MRLRLVNESVFPNAAHAWLYVLIKVKDASKIHASYAEINAWINCEHASLPYLAVAGNKGHRRSTER